MLKKYSPPPTKLSSTATSFNWVKQKKCLQHSWFSLLAILRQSVSFGFLFGNVHIPMPSNVLHFAKV